MTNPNTGQNVISFRQDLFKIDEIIKKSTKIKDGTPTQYHLNPKTELPDESGPYKIINFGEINKEKPHKTILMVGETGTGKTTLINVMVNYTLGVQRKDKVWFEITDEQSDRTSVQSQTSKITVYGFYLQESPVHLTIIDTPGYGNTCGVDLDKLVAERFFSLIKYEEEISELDAVCLVINATHNLFSERQQYIFDAIQSIFGKDIADNIVLLFTHSSGASPKNALKAVKEAGIKCAVNNQNNHPVFFLFDNCQSDIDDEEDERDVTQDQSWKLSFKGTKDLFKFLDTIKPKSLRMTLDVLQQRKLLEANVSNIRLCAQVMEQKQIQLKQELKKTYEDLKKEYDGKIGDGVSLVKKLEDKLQEVGHKKMKLVIEAFFCVETLEKIALNTNSLLTLLHVDFLIEKLKEVNEPEKATKLENIKKTQEGKKGALTYMKSFLIFL